MNLKPIANPLDGEHLLETSPTLAPESGVGWHRRLNFWSGRALTADAFDDEQAHRSGHLAARGGIVTPGVVRGLGVSLTNGQLPDPALLDGSPTITAAVLRDPVSIANKLKKSPDRVSVFVRGGLSASTRTALDNWSGLAPVPSPLLTGLATDLDVLVRGPSIWDETRFSSVNLRPGVGTLQKKNPTGAELAKLNRLLLEDAYPAELSRNALSSATVRVEPGLGLTASGDQVVLSRPLEVALGGMAWLFLDETGQPRPFNADDPEQEFTPDEQLLTSLEFPWVAVLLLQPTEVILIENRGPDDPCELDPESDAFADPRRVECGRFRLCILPASFLPPLTAAGRANHDASWRNRVAFHLFAQEANRLRRVGNLATKLANEASPWEQLGVPLGLVSFEPDLIDSTQFRLFLDRTSVVRPAGRPRARPRPELPVVAGAAPLWQAQIRQFAEQLGELPLRLNPDAANVAQHFRFIPPAGLLPRSALSLLTTDAARLFAPPLPGRPSDRAGTSHFFPSHWPVEAAPIPQDELDSALAASAPLAVMDLAAADPSRVRLLVPVPRAKFEPDLLVVAEPDRRVEDELKRLIRARQDWLWRRLGVRNRYAALIDLISGDPPIFPTLEADPERADDDEAGDPLDLFPTFTIFRTPKVLQEVSQFAFTVSKVVAGDPDPLIASNLAVLFQFFIDRETPPQAMRVVFEGALGRRVAVVWSDEGVTSRWGTAVDQEFRVGPVPEPGRWQTDPISLKDSGFTPLPIRRVSYEVLRGRVAVLAAVGFFNGGVAVKPFATTPEPGDWLSTRANPITTASPFEDTYDPEFADETTLESRLDEIDTAYRGGIRRKRKGDPLVKDGVTVAGGEPQDEPRKIDALGLEAVIRQLQDEADKADDFVDINFTRAQTNLYRIRKFVLGQNVAQKLLINPAIATIAEQETATATNEQLTTFIKAAKLQKVSRAELNTVLSDSPADAVAQPSLVGTVGVTKKVSKAPPIDLLKTRVTDSAFDVKVGKAIDLETTSPEPLIVPGVQVAGNFLDRFGTAAASVAFLPSVVDITSQLPETGATLPPRGLAISKRFEEPKASSTLGYARSALTQLLNQFPKLSLRLTGETIRGFKPKADNAAGFDEVSIPLVNLQGFNTNGTALDEQTIRRSDLMDQVLRVPVTGGSDDLDEATVTVAALDLTEVKTALLRSVERVVQQRRQIITRAQETAGVLRAKAQEAAQRLTVLDGKVAEARHDVSVARALWQEEIDRTLRLNVGRDDVIARVRFFAYVRPRTVDPVQRDVPSAPLDRADALAPVPECLQRHDQPPEELSEYVGLMRHAPARWFTDLAPRLKELDTPEKVVRLLESAKSNALRYSEYTAPSAKMRNSHPSISAIYEGRWRALGQKRSMTAQLGLYAAGDISWLQHHELASAHATLGDVVDARHGHAKLAGDAAAMMDQIREVATCLHAEFASVAPALRLAWTERLSQFDADADLRDLSILPRWGELSRTARRRFQDFVHWLFGRVDASQSEALDLINDLIRVVLLLASHAPVNQLIDGHIPRPTPVFLGGLVLVKPFDPGLIRAGMDVVIWDKAQVVARATVEDLRGGDTAIRMSQVKDKVSSIDPKMRVQFVPNGAKTSRAIK